MKLLYNSILIFILIFLFSCSPAAEDNNSDNSSNNSSGNESTVPSKNLSHSDFEYIGAFRLPDGSTEVKNWAWGGSSLTFNPKGDPNGNNDGYTGSLIGTGHAWAHLVSEISIPVPVNSKNLSELPTATTIQDFTEILNVTELEMPRTGLCYLEKQGEQNTDKIYYCKAEHLNEGGKLASHGMFELNFNSPQKKGLWKIGNLWNYVTCDYMFEIGKTWADKYIDGYYLATGRYRDGGQGSMGPTFVAIAPWKDGNPPASGAVLTEKELLMYDSVYQESPKTMDNYQHSDNWTGGEWLIAGDKAALIFVGTKGIGKCWYGYANGVVWEEPYPDVPPYPYDDRGWWSTEFKPYIVFYSTSDLADVAEGKKEANEIQPYETFDISEYLFNKPYNEYTIDNETHRVQRVNWLGACAFDKTNGIFYIFEQFADDDKPIVHVFKIN